MENREPVRVAHVSPGRIRLKFKPEKSDTPNLDDFSTIDGVKEVSFNKLTKSLLILYDKKVPTESVLDAIGKIPYLEMQGGIGSGVYTNGNGLRIARTANGLLELGGELFRQKNSKCLKFLERLFTIKEVKEVELDPASGKAWVKYSESNESSILKTLNEDVKPSEVLKERRRQKRHKSPLFSPWVFCCQPGERIKFVRCGELVTSWQVAHELPKRLRLKHRMLYRRPVVCRLVERTLYNTVGTKEFKTNSSTGSVLVVYEEVEITKVELIITLEKALAEISLEDLRKERFPLTGAALSTLSLGLSVGAFVFPILTPISVPLIIYTALPIYKRAFRDVLHKKIKVDILDAIVIGGCLVTGQIFAAALMVWIVDVGHSMLEGASKQSEVVLLQLFGQRVRFTRILVEGREEKYPIEKLRVGDTVVVYAGEQIPVDGVVAEGEGVVDQHIITGESAPVEVVPGTKVYASTLVVAGKIHIKAENVGKNTIEAKVKQIIEQSSKYKVKIQSTGERIADQMVLPTLGLASLGLATRGTSATLAIINADYGTGIRVAAPVALLAHLAKAAKHGIIVKKGSALEILPTINTFIFDKTGTLTREMPEVAEIIPAGGLDEKKILWYAAAAEQYFTHPIAKSILRKAEELNIQLPKIDKSAYHLGFGIHVTISGEEIKAGSARFMKREGIDVPTALEERAETFRRQGGSAIYISVNGALAGVIGLKSSRRLEAYDVVQQLKKMQKEIILVSGDHEGPTKILASELGINAYYAEILPHQKAEFIKMQQARGKKVAMVGDGVNDGPALSVADCSISLRGASDVAVDAADIVFMDGSLTRFEPLFRISQEFQGNVKRSWYLILVPNTLCIIGALIGVVGLGISLLLNNVFNFVATLNATIPLLAI